MRTWKTKKKKYTRKYIFVKEEGGISNKLN
jgi:hypothetical protein